MSRLLNDREMNMIKRYFDYDLSEQELEEFGKRLETDKAFADEVDNYESAYFTVDRLIIGNRTGMRAKGGWQKWLLGGVLLVGLLAAAFFLTQSGGGTDERIYAQADEYTRAMSGDILRGETDVTPLPDEEQRLKALILSYDEGAAPNIIPQLEAFVQAAQNPVNKELAEWWVANIHLQNGDLDAAKRALRAIKDNPNYNSAKKAASFLEGL